MITDKIKEENELQTQGEAKSKLDSETERAVAESLEHIKALADALICIVNCEKEEPLPGTLNSFGNMLIDKAEIVADSLGLTI